MSLTESMLGGARYARVADHIKEKVAFCFLEDSPDNFSVRYGKRCIIAPKIPDQGTAVAITQIMNDAVVKCQELAEMKAREAANQHPTLFDDSRTYPSHPESEMPPRVPIPGTGIVTTLLEKSLAGEV